MTMTVFTSMAVEVIVAAPPERVTVPAAALVPDLMEMVVPAVDRLSAPAKVAAPVEDRLKYYVSLPSAPVPIRKVSPEPTARMFQGFVRLVRRIALTRLLAAVVLLTTSDVPVVAPASGPETVRVEPKVPAPAKVAAPLLAIVSCAFAPPFAEKIT